MQRLGLASVVVVISLVHGSSSPARAQCAEWSDSFALRGLDEQVGLLSVFDDGSGPALLVGGQFALAGDVQAALLARWSGSAWSALGSGLGGSIPCCDPLEALSSIVFDDGSGPALYVGGRFITAGGVTVNNIARWDGANWSALGSGVDGAVYALASFDDGSGPALYAGGGFRNAGGATAHGIARWDGVSWSALGTGISGDPLCKVRALAVFDEGAGPVLFAGGNFGDLGGVALGGLGRWNGTSWSQVGGYANNVVSALKVHDDGSGPALFAGGKFTTIGGSPLARAAKWNGANWASLGSGLNGAVNSFAVFDGGSGTELIAGGLFDTAGGNAASGVAKWNGTTWTPLGTGLGSANSLGGNAYALGVFGGELYAGGVFNSAGGVGTMNLARWDGAQWSALGNGDGANGAVYALETSTVGFGGSPALYAGGNFSNLGDTFDSRIARWDGTSWSSVGGLGIVTDVSTYVSALRELDAGAGPRLYVGGLFLQAGNVAATNVAAWDGSNWLALGSGVNGSVSSFAAHDDGSGLALYVGGFFSIAGGTTARGIAKWDGATWSEVGGGFGFNGVRDLVVFDDGSGPALFAAGDFIVAGGASATGFARWDGASWTPLGTATIHNALALAEYDDGSGPALFAIVQVGNGVGATRNLAKWDGSSLTLVGGALTPLGGSPLGDLFVFDDGSGAGDELYVAGHFNVADGLPVNGIAKWNGAAWSALDGGLTSIYPNAYDSPHALAAFDDGSGGAPDLFVGGYFTHAGGDAASYIASWRGCTPALGTPYCFGDGSGSACPCGNASALGAEQGCAHSSGVGATLTAQGSTSIASDDQTFTVVTMPANKSCVLFVGNAALGSGNGVPFGDGLRCAGPSVHRLGVSSSDAFGVASWGPGFSPLGYWSAGDTRYFQVWFRDPTGPCGNATNMSSALAVAFTN